MLQPGYALFGMITGKQELPHSLPFSLTRPSNFVFRLEWDEADFGDADVIRIDPNKIWLPDIEVYNMAVSITGY